MREPLSLPDAPAQSFLIIVEKRELSVRSRLLVMFARQAIGARGHPIAGVVGEQIDAFTVEMIVEQLGFVVVELLDFKLKFGSYFRRPNAHSLCL